MAPIQVVIVDPHDLSRHGLQLLLTQADFPVTIVGAYYDLHDLRLKENFAGVMLMDDKLPHHLSLSRQLQKLKKQYPLMQIVILSTSLNLAHIQVAMNNGATGFIYKEERLNLILPEAIHTAYLGKRYFSPQAWALHHYGQVQHLLDQLNPHDLEVLYLIAQGFTVQEIATQAEITPRSVYRIRERLRQVLEVRTNEQIVDAARQRGLLHR